MKNAQTFESSEKNLLAAVDLGGTSAKIGLFLMPENAEGYPQLLKKSSLPTWAGDAGGTLTAIVRAIEEMIPRTDGGKIAAIGIGVPGPIAELDDGRVLVNRCVNLDWEVTDVCENLRELTGVSCIALLNDANAAALGELHFGCLRAGTDELSSGSLPEEAVPADTARPAFSGFRRSPVLLTLGTGIGGGIIRSGRPVNGTNGAAGELGHMPLSPRHPLLDRILAADPDALNPSADLEYYVSARGIGRVAEAAIGSLPEFARWRQAGRPEDRNTSGFCLDESGPQSRSLPAGGPDARAIFDGARQGDSRALELTDFFFDTLGRGLAAIAAVIDPSVFIIGGGMSAAGDFLLRGLEEKYREYAFHASRGTPLILAQLGNDAGIFGAAAAALDELKAKGELT